MPHHLQETAIILVMTCLPACRAPIPVPTGGITGQVLPGTISGQRIDAGELGRRLEETSGRVVLEEMIIDEGVRDRLLAAGMTMADSDMKKEEERLLRSLSPDPDSAVRLLDAIRSDQGLGPRRYEALLWRNAGLRKLVAGDIIPSDTLLRTMFNQHHGARRRARILTVNDHDRVEHIRTELERGVRFELLAARWSTDWSGATGGLVEPVSIDDPRYPASLRDAIWSLETIGTHSAPIALEHGYALVELVEEIPPDGSEMQIHLPELRRQARENLERIQMERLARTILATARVRLPSSSLRWNWSATQP